jgi:DNA ligase-1
MERIDSTTKKLEKTALFADFLQKLSPNELPPACYFATAQTFSKKSQLKLQLGWSSFLAVVHQLSSRSRKELESFYRQKADFGSMVEWAMLKRKPQPQVLISFFENQSDNNILSLVELETKLREMSSFKGKGSLQNKKKELVQLLQIISPLESKYIARIITSDTRTGFQEGLLLDAISQAFQREKDHVRYAHMVLSDIGEVALAAKDPNCVLTTISPQLFRPLRSMLATKVETVEKALETYSQLICEPKIDGFRAQIHINKERIKIFSRNLEDVTNAFPEIVNSISDSYRDQVAPCILDGEIVSLVDNKPVFFQDISTRILRKTNISNSVLKTPCYYFAFDFLLFQGNSFLRTELLQRKEKLAEIPTSNHLRIISFENLDSPEVIHERFQEAIKDGYEGLMLKDPSSLYLAGKRGKGWLKFKATLPTLDLVIVGAEWGHGRRTGWLSNYHLAAQDKNEFHVIGKTFKGLTDEEFEQMTEELKSLAVNEESFGIKVQPQVIVEVEFDNIQESSKYSSGMALRFARIKRIRNDKNITDIDSIDTVRQLYQDQLRRQKRTNKA